MRANGRVRISLVIAAALCARSRVVSAKDRFASHPPMRALPAASSRPAAKGPAYFVDPIKGDDGADGSTKKPWKSIGHALPQLEAGDTLYLHGGVYFETVTVSVAGTDKAPITIRSAPGELAIVDGGLREFEETPAAAWEPFAGGAPDEYVSTAAYPAIDKGVGKERGVWVLGNFADSMVPLHGYRFVGDLRSTNEYWNLADKVAPDQNIYVGPGVWLDWKSHRIHARLAHTALKSLGDDNYRGETDPRKLPLVIGIDHHALTIAKASHVRVQDLVVRGSATHTLDVLDSDHVELDGVTIYGGSPALYVRSTHHLALIRSRVRGVAAPWSSRASMKYRGDSPYLVVAGSKAPRSHDWEFAYDEFTDGHDGIVIDSVKTLRFHHDRLDNFNDDGVYLTLPPRDSPPDDIQIYENYVTRIQTTLSFAEPDDHAPNTIGSGAYIYRNVFDLRGGTYAWPPADAAADGAAITLPSRMCGDHGSPTWEPLFFYQNTVLTADEVQHQTYGELMASHTKATTRRVFNNVFVQVAGNPGLNFPSVSDDLQVDGDLLWGIALGPAQHGDFFAAFRASSAFETSKRVYAPGFAAGDIYADPKLVHLSDDETSLDLRLGDKSPAIDAGVPIPAAWPDSLRKLDTGKPDIGALPRGAPMLRVGPAAAPAPAP